ncbi:MAG: thiamine pyrophosphate-dependent enzyme, partial [Halobacteriales archaeon]|nr:thiamine pyrophosphate-dependent enzyme [Halobacteriales archaeon]
ARSGSGGPLTEAGSGDTRATNRDIADALYSVAPDAVLMAEAPTSVGAFRSRFNFDHGQFFQNRGGGLGYGLPAAVGMAVAESEADRPARTIVALVGDGSYLYYPQTLYSAARYDLDLTVLVPDNRNYRILKDNTLRILGGEEADYDFIGMDFIPAVDIPASADAHGATGHFVEDRDAVAQTLETAIGESGPSVVDVLTRD